MSKKQKPVIRIFHNLARSGGTIVGKCLGSMKNIYLLSEIHPRGCDRFNPITQAHGWHGLFDSSSLADLGKRKEIPFREAIRIIEQRSRTVGGYLVLRDWAHLDFMAVPFLEKPTYKLLLTEALRPDFEPCQVALVRHPVDEWLSLRKLAILDGKLKLSDYMEGFLRFAEYAANIGYVRYEDFTHDPQGIMKQICDQLRLPRDPSFIDKWFDYNKITGDVGGGSRGGKLNRIIPLKRSNMERGLIEKFRSDPNYHKALSLLGYEDVNSRNGNGFQNG